MLGVGGLVVVWIVWSRRPGSGVVIDRLLLRMPYLGRLMRMYATSQLARTLSTLLSGGLPLVNAMEVAPRTRSATARWRPPSRAPSR